MRSAGIGNISTYIKRIYQKKLIWSVNSSLKFQFEELQKNSFSTGTDSYNSLIGPDFIVRSSAQNFEPVTGATIPEYVWKDLPMKENAPALECAETGKKLTHGDVYRQSRSFATALIQSGIKHRNVISVLLPNMPDYTVVLFGIFESGAIASPINPGYMEDEISRQIQMSEAKVIITIPQLLPTIHLVQESCPILKSIIVIGEPHEGCHTYSEMLKVNSNSINFLKGSQINTKEEVAILPFSSGTTGPPKGVQLTHSNLCCNLKQYTSPDISALRKLGIGEEQERIIGILPFFHSYGISALVLTNELLGTNMLTIPKFHPDTFVKYLKYFRPTTLTLVPPLISFLANTPKLTAKDFASVDTVQSGAAPLGTALINKFLIKVEKDIFIQELYGLTELSPASHGVNPSRGKSKLGSIGTLIPGTFGKIVEVDTGKLLGPMERGELCVKGPQVMKGYFKNEEATKNCIDSEGWFYTGDIGYYDEDGCFYIVDRIKELIKVKGLQVAPAELEDYLRKMPEVEDVAVIGIPDHICGELPRAYIVRKSEAVTESNINEFLNGKISKHKELKGGIEFVTVIPKAASGKILRRELKADYLSKHSQN